jgi:mRNA-degrading endonuclease RelE of RelBE toxin-antitoxin system
MLAACCGVSLAFEIEFDPEAVKDLKKPDRSIQQRLINSSNDKKPRLLS